MGSGFGIVLNWSKDLYRFNKPVKNAKGPHNEERDKILRKNY